MLAFLAVAMLQSVALRLKLSVETTDLGLLLLLEFFTEINGGESGEEQSAEQEPRRCLTAQSQPVEMPEGLHANLLPKRAARAIHRPKTAQEAAEPARASESVCGVGLKSSISSKKCSSMRSTFFSA